MHMKQAVTVIFFLLATLGACSKKASTDGQSATLALKDGTTVIGTVTKSDASSITIQTPNGVVSTYPVSQVSSINYGPGPGSTSNPPAGEPAPQQPTVVPPPAPSDSSSAATAATPPSGQPGSAPPPARDYQPAETFHTIPSGTTLVVRTDQSIDSKTAAPGQTYPGVVARDVFDSSGQVAIPRGSSATLVIRESRAQGKVEGRPELVLDVVFAGTANDLAVSVSSATTFGSSWAARPPQVEVDCNHLTYFASADGMAAVRRALSWPDS